jgi:cyclin-dependent kinase 8/11
MRIQLILITRPLFSAFLGLPSGASYPMRRVTHDDNDPKLSHGGPLAPKMFAVGTGGGSSAVGSGMGVTTAVGRGKRGRLD